MPDVTLENNRRQLQGYLVFLKLIATTREFTKSERADIRTLTKVLSGVQMPRSLDAAGWTGAMAASGYNHNTEGT